jgi:hypothetical protein
MNPDVANVLIVACVLAVFGLCGYSAGWIQGSKEGRKQLEREQARTLALDRLSKLPTTPPRLRAVE